MLPDRVSNPGPLIYESGALPIALRGPAGMFSIIKLKALYYMNVWSVTSMYDLSTVCMI